MKEDININWQNIVSVSVFESKEVGYINCYPPKSMRLLDFIFDIGLWHKNRKEWIIELIDGFHTFEKLYEFNKEKHRKYYFDDKLGKVIYYPHVILRLTDKRKLCIFFHTIDEANEYAHKLTEGKYIKINTNSNDFICAEWI